MKASQRILLSIAIACASMTAGTPVTAQPYPSRPVTVIVPFAAGGATSLVARVFAKVMERFAGQPFIIENAGGAGATLGTAKAAMAKPDGYTVLLGVSSALVMAPHLYDGLKYDPFKSFEPIARIASAPYVIVTRAESKFQRFEDLIDSASSNPDRINYGSSGEGSALHLTAVLLLDNAKVKATHIPYRGSAPAWTALLAGDVDFIVDTPSAVLPMIDAGKARALAVTGGARLPELSGVRTLSEIGQKNFDSQAWFAILVPKETPAPAVAALRKQAEQALRDPEFLAMLKTHHFTPAIPADSANLSSDIRSEYDKWGSVIRARNIQLR